jgi:hypothetical protein
MITAEAIQENSNIFKEFSDVLREGLERTKVEKKRIESFIPRNLRQSFRDTEKSRDKTPDTPETRAVVEYMRKDLFGKLPDFDARIETSHADGFLINGELREIFMSRVVGKVQLEREFRHVDSSQLIGLAHSQLKGQFPLQSIKSIIIAHGSNGINRQLAASIIKIARDMT